MCNLEEDLVVSCELMKRHLSVGSEAEELFGEEAGDLGEKFLSHPLNNCDQHNIIICQ